ncbi:hypothetical protein J1N35_007703 [Gossypium stocksii]|uniref:Uncharacterized protein n=1 Tax=Gossypium stocksii TaxID=47602 RepID=A0A9D3W9P7_9ROSI|nr:hypothetical protein J1N35_007703 [Gossypium stocksii]
MYMRKTEFLEKNVNTGFLKYTVFSFASSVEFAWLIVTNIQELYLVPRTSCSKKCLLVSVDSKSWWKNLQQLDIYLTVDVTGSYFVNFSYTIHCIEVSES